MRWRQLYMLLLAATMAALALELSYDTTTAPHTHSSMSEAAGLLDVESAYHTDLSDAASTPCGDPVHELVTSETTLCVSKSPAQNHSEVVFGRLSTCNQLRQGSQHATAESITCTCSSSARDPPSSNAASWPSSSNLSAFPVLSQSPSNLSDTSIASIGDVDECRFMSFEEWKRQKQEEAQESVSSSETVVSSSSTVRANSSSVSTVASSSSPALDDDPGHVYKDKFNYASSDCAATIVKANSQAKGALAILQENKDTYLLNQCSSPNKAVVIEMCQDILVSEVVIGNFEFFSSMFKDIRVSVSDRFPAAAWEVVGEFEAENVRDLQVFPVKNPLIWARYLKLEILSHYGNEFYCPISVVRVHGKTMMEEFKEEQVVELKYNGTVVVDKVANSTGVNGSSRDDECRVVLPHLLLHEFLQDINGTDQYCEAVAIREVKTAETTATTQESIYKNIMKRLSLLESNATLSLLYIEEQSKLLSTAFSNLERRQTGILNSLVDSFNATMVAQMAHMREAYQKIQREGKVLLQRQESRHRGGLSDANYRIGIMANEIRFHRRITLFNTLIILCLLAYVVLTRDVAIDDFLAHQPRPSHPVSRKRAFKRKKVGRRRG